MDLTVVMYHYVRNLTSSRYPRIKALPVEVFEAQLENLVKYYVPCSLEQVIMAVKGQEELPPKACLLTFDDGFIDHYLTVFPALIKRELTGVFFLPAKPIEERKVLDVHKIHFILATVENPSILVNEILTALRRYRSSDHSMEPAEELYLNYANADEYDSAEIVFVKAILQRVLPNSIRSEMIDSLFAKYVQVDERTFANELYMNVDQIKCMARYGMSIGGHGYNHLWFDSLDLREQEMEIERTRSFLSEVCDNSLESWAIAYPYGSYNRDTLDILRRAGCTIGFTARPGIIKDLARPLELARVDTRDVTFESVVMNAARGSV